VSKDPGLTADSGEIDSKKLAEQQPGKLEQGAHLKTRTVPTGSILSAANGENVGRLERPGVEMFVGVAHVHI
jgi:hypothetical protein